MDEGRPAPEDQSGPRPHHYGYAHQALPPLMLRKRPSPAELEALVEAGFFQALWDQISEMIPEEDRMSPVGLRAEFHQLGECGVAVVQMPPAEATAEAISIAVVSRPYRWLWLLTRHEVRYITLERSISFVDGAIVEGGSTVLGEWSAGGHSNYGDGPDGSIPDFLEAVASLLDL